AIGADWDMWLSGTAVGTTRSSKARQTSRRASHPVPKFGEWFSQTASAVSRWTGRPAAFLGCALIVVVWGLSGPVFHYSDTWQLVINTGTTIVTFLMVFLIQNSQNRDAAAMQAKLDEIIRTSHAHNRFIGIEHHRRRN